MADFTWKIEQIEVAPNEGGFENVAKVLHWRCIATDSEFETSTYGSVGLDSPDPEDFEVYETLTETQVIGWLHGKLEEIEAGKVDSIEANLVSVLQKQISPPVVPAPLPWE